jgi:hypothetical protein
MIIFQTAGSGDTSSFGLGRAPLGAPATTFRSNAYIHRLNRALQAEMRAVSAYRSLDARGAPVSGDFLDEAETGHQENGKALVRLIIANRGIPEDRSVLSLGLTRTFIQLCALVPSELSRRATQGTLRQLEKGLAGGYRKLLQAAPPRDAHVLEELLGSAERRAAELANAAPEVR